MAIIELTLSIPEPVGRTISSGRLRTLAETAWAREFAPGTRRENITDDRWNHQSHSWWLTVRRDGIGVLEIKPEWQRAEIHVVHHHRPQRLRGVMYTLDKPQVQLLAGTQIMDDEGRKETMLFKLICCTDGKTLPF